LLFQKKKKLLFQNNNKLFFQNKKKKKLLHQKRKKQLHQKKNYQRKKKVYLIKSLMSLRTSTIKSTVLRSRMITVKLYSRIMSNTPTSTTRSRIGMCLV
jgi:hypothetical protein